MRNVNHVQQQVRLTHLVKGRFERLNQVMRQLAYEPHRIRQEKRQVAKHNLPDCCVKCGKQLVLSKEITLADLVHQG